MNITKIPHRVYLTLTRDAGLTRERLADLTPLEVFDRWLTWLGIVGFSEDIFEAAWQLHLARQSATRRGVDTATHFYAHPQQAGLPAQAETLIAMTVGERGYATIRTRLAPIELNPEGTTDEILESAIAGSMFGWETKAARLALTFDSARR
jgi:hypothetical protein